MNKDLWDFIGVSRSSSGEANQILDIIISKMFGALGKFLNMPYQNYRNLDEMINDGIYKDNQYTYFWKWFKDYGQMALHKISSTHFISSDDTLDCLEDRLFIIESDIDNGLISSVFESIASTFTAIENLISTNEELAISTGDHYKSIYTKIVEQVPKSEPYKNFDFQNSVAIEQQSFF
ncbi:hypothetical protein CA600_21185 [Paenibacillus sp. VTT E-133280]|jgi:hypothetical protein|uniref:hypothetical protein n=1 Tax=Paenibacillus sp. VTT E-133280 TaxID=1986222 RepID=UPI000BA0F5DC|nr:hypothetical protein [Paenibacillus sp. VTT E-133280]OZQ62780.1 hypothetical protein CA600_21185 [Paenibacillus sp. VTT E-133280]